MQRRFPERTDSSELQNACWFCSCYLHIIDEHEWHRRETFFLSLLIGYGDSLEDKSKANMVQIKGRFSVTSENVDLVKVSLQSLEMVF